MRQGHIQSVSDPGMRAGTHAASVEQSMKGLSAILKEKMDRNRVGTPKTQTRKGGWLMRWLANEVSTQNVGHNHHMMAT